MDLVQTLITALLGAAGGAIPLWIRLRNAQVGIKQKEAELDLAISEEKDKQSQHNKINTEAEWKRILEYRDAELLTLRARDEQQERQIKDLYEKHVKCETDKARTEARLESMEKHQERIELELAQLKALMKGLPNGISQGTSSASG